MFTTMSTARGTLLGRANTRDVSFKTRMRYAYGCDQQHYDEILKYKKNFEKCMAIPPQDKVEKFLTPPSLDVNNNIEPSELELGIEGDLTGLSIAFTATFNKTLMPKTLEDGDSISLDEPFSRKGGIANVGGLIVSLKWLPILDLRQEQYCAVSVINTPISDSINNFQLSSFPKPLDKSLQTSLQIWKYWPDTHALTRHALIDTTGQIGVCNDIAWLPAEVPGSLGAVCGCFNDGKWHLITIPLEEGNWTLRRTSVTFEIPDVPITAADFRSPHQIIVGTVTGHLAQFELPGQKAEYETEPQWMLQCFITSVTTVLVISDEPGTDVALATSAGVPAIAMELNNFVVGQVLLLSPKTWIKPSYNPRLRLYLTVHSLDTLAYMFSRAPTESSTLLVRISSTITCHGTLERLGHPLGLMGTLDGDLVILNYARKLLNGVKSSKNIIAPIRVWKVTYVDDNLVVDGNFYQLPSESPNQLPITPPDVVFSACSWNENPASCQIYAAGTISGLLFVEYLV